MFFENGFRVFFFLAFAFATIFIFSWLLCYSGLILIHPLFNNLLIWHGHEMVYGFVIAVISGFLLTAVAMWTSTPPIKGRALIALSLLWLLGRIEVTFTIFNPLIASIIDLSYIPFLMFFFAKPLFSSHNKRNYIILGFLGLLFFCNLIIHLAHTHLLNDAVANNALYASLGVILLFITLIGGRVIPFFTINALNRFGFQLKNTPQPMLDSLTLITMVIFIFTILVFSTHSKSTGYAALAVAIVHGCRMGFWHTRYCFMDPLLWILHSAYLWMIVGMIFWFYSTVVTNEIPISISLHLITIGCISSLCLGMMARVSLGHTGRPLQISKFMTVSFLLMQLCVLLRFAGAFFTHHYMQTISGAGAFWTIAFILYGIVYTPILYRPRMAEVPSVS